MQPRWTRHTIALLAACLAAVVAGPARADICQAVDKATAEAGARLIRAAGVLIYEDWFAPTPVAHVEVRPWEELWEVVVNDGVSVDLAHAYLPADGGVYVSLGWQVGCGDPTVAETVRAEPFAPTTDPPSPPPPVAADRIQGVVEAPRLYDAYLAMAELEAPAILRATPSPDAAQVVAARSLEDLVPTEFSYEGLGLAVYGGRDGWYETRYDGAPAWLPPAESGAFHPIAELLTQNLAYLDYAWDGFLLEGPDRAAARSRLDGSWRLAMGEQIEVDIQEARVVGDELWLRLAVIWPSPCTGEDPAAVATGWVPAYAPTGALNAWFYAAGC